MGRARAVVRATVAVLAATLVTVGTGVPSSAVPPPPPNPSDDALQSGRQEVHSTAEEVGVLANRVAAAGADVEAAQLELARTFETATQALQARDAARAIADAAQAVADARRQDADAAGASVQSAQQDLDDFAAASYRQGSLIGSVAGFLGSGAPEDLLARAEFLDAVGGARLDALEAVRRARVAEVNRESAARAALDEARVRQRAAEDAKAAADSAYAAAVTAGDAARRRSEELLAAKAELERQLDTARRSLAGLEGQRRAFEDHQRAREAEAAAAAAAAASAVGAGPPSATPQDLPLVIDELVPGGVVAPTTGRITSRYGPRGGTIHYGTDIANRIGTPIYSVKDGKVISAGPASGFGLWVRVRHDDATVTVYGHIDRYFVSVGERVTAGEQIATVGNGGESTGPHLHFEVVRGGTKVDPLVWLRNNGVRIGDRTM